jgi:hypothetical protein
MLGLFGLLCLALPTHAEDSADGPASAKLQQQLLTDENIADLCRASIKQKYDMVEAQDENGVTRKVPRCVANYEAMRAVAQNYLKQEDAATGQIVQAISSCVENPDQSACLEAGHDLAAKAADMHEALSRNASDAKERLAAAIAIHR